MPAPIQPICPPAVVAMCQPGTVLECVINVSEGRRRDAIDAMAQAGRGSLLDVHSDEYHHRSVFTLAGPDVQDDSRALAALALDLIDLASHSGVHPRLGALDVVPFVPLTGSSMEEALAARDNFAAWAGIELGLSCFLYGPERSLPEVRRNAFSILAPDTGPSQADPRRGACAVGARELMVAYNVCLDGPEAVPLAVAIATEMRSESVRALGLDLGGRAQVSFNLLSPELVGPAVVYDAVASEVRLSNQGVTVTAAELVGLVPRSVLTAIPSARWDELDLGSDKTIEWRLDARRHRRSGTTNSH